MPYGLTDIELQKLTMALSSVSGVKKAILYGSRAKGNYKPFSDIDITLVGDSLSRRDLNVVSRALDDLLLPYQIDLSLYDTLKNEDLIEHINHYGVEIFVRQ
ncbi:MAG: nucleotidyltransferase domain-containing protein [Candidatus Cryptobacteroides sp.]|nr:nucleotidyltransferase domain-containing protein [Bacteroidales bacterium]MDY2774841.1 nucleotidyltransferase domain-containing protein [Candidatus Cryptobacteroides sp.]